MAVIRRSSRSNGPGTREWYTAPPPSPPVLSVGFEPTPPSAASFQLVGPGPIDLAGAGFSRASRMGFQPWPGPAWWFVLRVVKCLLTKSIVSLLDCRTKKCKSRCLWQDSGSWWSSETRRKPWLDLLVVFCVFLGVTLVGSASLRERVVQPERVSTNPTGGFASLPVVGRPSIGPRLWQGQLC